MVNLQHFMVKDTHTHTLYILVMVNVTHDIIVMFNVAHMIF